MVPEAVNSAASLPRSAAVSDSSSRTVGSSPNTSSPTSARAMVSRMAAVGLVTVSLRKSMTSIVVAFTPDQGLKQIQRGQPKLNALALHIQGIPHHQVQGTVILFTKHRVFVRLDSNRPGRHFTRSCALALTGIGLALSRLELHL